MALILNIESEYGITFPNSYARIEEIGGNKTDLSFRLRYYKDKAAVSSGFSWLHEKVFAFQPNVEDGSPNFWKQGYEHLKTLPEFLAAYDDLEE